jgi:hypothetical protein
MARSGPVTKDTSTLALGLAQIRVGSSAEHISSATPVLTATDSIGSLASTKFTSTREFWRHESGFPLLEDHIIPLRETAAMECTFEEITPANIAMAMGKDPALFTNAHEGVVPLGASVVPVKVRMEAVYTYPDGHSTLTYIFPAAQCTSDVEIDMQAEDNASPTLTFEAKRADSEVVDGDAAWDSMPLGCVVFRDEAPNVKSAEVNADKATLVVVTYDQEVKVADKNLFSVTVNGVASVVSSAAVSTANAKVVELTLSKAVVSGDNVRLLVGDGAVTSVSTSKGNPAESRAVTNNV